MENAAQNLAVLTAKVEGKTKILVNERAEWIFLSKMTILSDWPLISAQSGLFHLVVEVA